MIINTAGHIDHGKTSLIAAITGFWGDSTPAERERGITIDLSFSDWRGISFIDIPGHENLLKTALSGLQSPFALLVVDINEGLMPQSAEHIFALRITRASTVILALNKCDLMPDLAARRSAAERIVGEIAALGVQVARVFYTSCKSGEGVEELAGYIESLAAGGDGAGGRAGAAYIKGNARARDVAGELTDGKSSGENANSLALAGAFAEKSRSMNSRVLSTRDFSLQPEKSPRVCFANCTTAAAGQSSPDAPENLSRPERVSTVADATDELLRIYVDRVFSLPGIGSVATGFLAGGELVPGDYFIAGAAKTGGKTSAAKSGTTKSAKSTAKSAIKIRSLEHQHAAAERIKAPARAAFRFSGELAAPCVLSARNSLKSSGEIYCSKRLAPGVLALAAEGAELQFISRNQAASARVYEAGPYLRIVLARPLVLCFADAYFLLANGRIACGGEVLSPLLEPLKRRKMPALLAALERRDFAAAFALLSAAHPGGFGLFSAPQRFGLSTAQAVAIAKTACDVVHEEGANCFSAAHLDALEAKIRRIYEQNHFAMQSAASLSKSLGEEVYLCDLALGRIEFLRAERGLFVRADVDFAAVCDAAGKGIAAAIDQLAPLAPYNIYDELAIDRASGDAMLKALCKAGRAVRLAHNYFISARALAAAMKELRALSNGGAIGVQEVKAALGISRKYAIALLEYADAQPGVQKQGDKRIFKEH